jgi:hypothetical protein
MQKLAANGSVGGQTLSSEDQQRLANKRGRGRPGKNNSDFGKKHRKVSDDEDLSDEMVANDLEDQ